MLKKLHFYNDFQKILAMLKYDNNISLKNYNTFGIDVQAKHFYRCTHKNDLHEFLEQTYVAPLFILGEGSNVLFTRDYEGSILKPDLKGIKVLKENDQYVYVEVGAGENWDEFVAYCSRKNWSGIENLSLIPGTVGSSPVQNIGAYGVEVKDVIQSVFAIHLSNRKELEFSNADCQFGYRSSIFKKELKGKVVIYKVVFKLNKQHSFKLNYGTVQQELEKFNEINIENVRQAIISIRRSKLPEPDEMGNAGSFFKNPIVQRSKQHALQAKYENMPSYPVDDEQVKLAAGWLIDQCQLKGFKYKDAGVHEKQALVLVNYGNATGKDILALAELVQEKVVEKFGIQLEPEVNIL